MEKGEKCLFYPGPVLCEDMSIPPSQPDAVLPYIRPVFLIASWAILGNSTYLQVAKVEKHCIRHIRIMEIE